MELRTLACSYINLVEKSGTLQIYSVILLALIAFFFKFLFVKLRISISVK